MTLDKMLTKRKQNELAKIESNLQNSEYSKQNPDLDVTALAKTIYEYQQSQQAQQKTGFLSGIKNIFNRNTDADKGSKNRQEKTREFYQKKSFAENALGLIKNIAPKAGVAGMLATTIFSGFFNNKVNVHAGQNTSAIVQASDTFEFDKTTQFSDSENTTANVNKITVIPGTTTTTDKTTTIPGDENCKPFVVNTVIGDRIEKLIIKNTPPPSTTTPPPSMPPKLTRTGLTSFTKTEATDTAPKSIQSGNIINITTVKDGVTKNDTFNLKNADLNDLKVRDKIQVISQERIIDGKTYKLTFNTFISSEYKETIGGKDYMVTTEKLSDFKIENATTCTISAPTSTTEKVSVKGSDASTTGQVEVEGGIKLDIPKDKITVDMKDRYFSDTGSVTLTEKRDLNGNLEYSTTNLSNGQQLKLLPGQKTFTLENAANQEVTFSITKFTTNQAVPGGTTSTNIEIQQEGIKTCIVRCEVKGYDLKYEFAFDGEMDDADGSLTKRINGLKLVYNKNNDKVEIKDGFTTLTLDAKTGDVLTINLNGKAFKFKLVSVTGGLGSDGIFNQLGSGNIVRDTVEKEAKNITLTGTGWMEQLGVSSAKIVTTGGKDYVTLYDANNAVIAQVLAQPGRSVEVMTTTGKNGIVLLSHDKSTVGIIAKSSSSSSSFSSLSSSLDSSQNSSSNSSSLNSSSNSSTNNSQSLSSSTSSNSSSLSPSSSSASSISQNISQNNSQASQNTASSEQPSSAPTVSSQSSAKSVETAVLSNQTTKIDSLNTTGKIVNTVIGGSNNGESKLVAPPDSGTNSSANLNSGSNSGAPSIER